MDIDKNPDDPRHFYDYKAAYKAGEPIPKKGEHMSSLYKHPLHDRRFVSGEEANKPEFALWDSLEEREASMQEAVKANYDREQLLEEYGF